MSADRSRQAEVKKDTETEKSADSWAPKIIGFACNWCTYAGADLAGTSRIKYPADIRVIRLMCTGRIDPAFILRAFFRGADGIFIGGCHPGECHYQSGNFRAKSRVLLTKKLLNQFGLEPERLQIEWISASEGARFAKVVKDFTEKIRSLGPSTIKRK